MANPSFGDRRYDEADLTPQIVGHPDAAFSFLLGNILREAYLHAQQHGRVLIQQTWGYRLRDFAGDLASARASTASGTSAWVGVTRGWAKIPRETNYLIAEVFYALLNFERAEVTHRLTARNGSGCNSDTSADEFAADDRAGLMISNGTLIGSRNDVNRYFDAEFPFTNVFSVRSSVVALELTTGGVGIASPGLCDIRLEAHALRTTDAETYSIPVPYMPLFAQVCAAMEWAT